MKKSIVLWAILPLIGFCICSKIKPLAENDADYSKQSESACVQSQIMAIENFDESETFRQMVNIIHNSFSEFSPSVQYDKENALVNIIVIAGEGTTDSLEGKTQGALASWRIIVNSLSGLSKSGYEILSSEKTKIGCTVMMLSDENPDTVLFAALNGSVIYDVMEG